jgi:hypothetical protein
MPIVATGTGAHSTLDVILGAGVLIWALGSVTALLAWTAKLAPRRSARRGTAGRRGTPVRRVLRPARAAPTAVPAAVDRVGGIAAVVGPRWNRTETEAPRIGLSAGAAEPSAASGSPGSPVIEGPRCSPETLEPLAEHLDASHALALAEARVAHTLAALPSDRWLVERYALIGGHRIPFLLLGGTGVFTVWALSGPPTWDELPIPAHVATHVESALPGYTGPLRVGICRALAPSGIEPRWWCRPGEPGAWVMGLDWLIRWIEHYGREHGLGAVDLQRLRELSQPKPGPAARVPDVVPDLR